MNAASTSSYAPRLQLGAVGMPEPEIALGEFVEEWWRVHVISSLATSTRKSYRLAWAKQLLPKLGAYRVCEITPKVVARFRAEVLADGVGEQTVLRAPQALPRGGWTLRGRR